MPRYIYCKNLTKDGLQRRFQKKWVGVGGGGGGWGSGGKKEYQGEFLLENSDGTRGRGKGVSKENGGTVRLPV